MQKKKLLPDPLGNRFSPFCLWMHLSPLPFSRNTKTASRLSIQQTHLNKEVLADTCTSFLPVSERNLPGNQLFHVTNQVMKKRSHFDQINQIMRAGHLKGAALQSSGITKVKTGAETREDKGSRVLLSSNLHRKMNVYLRIELKMSLESGINDFICYQTL